jgi:hypothetical protein
MALRLFSYQTNLKMCLFFVLFTYKEAIPKDVLYFIGSLSLNTYTFLVCSVNFFSSLGTVLPPPL